MYTVFTKSKPNVFFENNFQVVYKFSSNLAHSISDRC